jgi:hypothetical protein
MLLAGAWLNCINAVGIASRAAQFPSSGVVDSFYPSDIGDPFAIVTPSNLNQSSIQDNNTP